MNTQPQSARIVLKDGKSRIADWPHEDGTHLTVGDRVALPQDVGTRLPGYLAEATVTRVEFDTATGGWNIEADAGCPVIESQRPVVTLNASRIEESQRAEVETHLRGRLEFPVFDWEESYESAPILRLHDHGSDLQGRLPELQKEVIGLLKVSPELSVI